MSPSDNSEALGFDPQSLDSGGMCPPPNELFRALANDKRRRLLTVLDDEDATDIDDLTDVLVGWESTIDGPAGPDEWAQIKIELVHAHLPMLADAGLVTHDSDADEVSLESLADPVKSLVDFAGQYEEATETADIRSEP